MQRRNFLKKSVPVLLFLANGNFACTTSNFLSRKVNRNNFRFVVASDGHYGQPNIPSAENFKTLVDNINLQHSQRPLSFTVINGDIIHDEPAFFPAAKKSLDALKMPYYVTQGNHDKINAAGWQEVWKMPVNLSFTEKDQAFILGTTSNEKGEYICPDLTWFEQQLNKYKAAANIFIFIHITPIKWTDHGIDCPEFINLLKNYKNVRAVFNGHDHNQDDLKIKNNIPYLFDAHFGGSWGTAYKGFRMVELLPDNTLATYMLNPTEKIKEHLLDKGTRADQS